ncbi:MAG: DegQ family serine endoprotease [Gammaproteobacteria bacterium]|nr:DegQ family serine endoprotease [Gammaproteobacteria bacterium]
MKITMRYFPVMLLVCLLSFGLSTNNIAQEKPGDRPGIAGILEGITPAVVNISVTGSAAIPQNPLLNDPFFRRFFNVPEQPQTRPVQSAGSGVIIDADEGYVLTNHHVVNNAEEIEITLQDRRRVTAELVGSDAGTDIALLRIVADSLVAIARSDSETLRVGDYVAAIGNPFGIGQTVTTGMVSALGRQTGISQGGYEDFIQTDASINPGNSGGALVDYNGNLVGINTAIIAPAGGNVGIGFAVPINMVMAVVEQLLEFGEIRRGMLGVQITDLDPDLVEALELQVTRGAVVSSVVADSPAENVGIEAGDIIVSVDGEPVESASDLRNIIGLTRAGTEVEIGVVRENRGRNFAVQIGDSPDVASESIEANATSVLEGAELNSIPLNHSAYGEVEGVYISAVTQGSRAFRNGLEAGDIITAVNRQPVSTRRELIDILEENSGTVAMNVLRGQQQLFLIMR